MPRDMRSCSQNAVCPKCKYEFACCRRSLVLSGGGLVDNPAPGVNPAPPPSLPSPGPASAQINLVSPSTPLSFGFPLPLQSLPPPQATNQDAEFQQLRDTVQALRQSGWFYEGISFDESHEMLKDTEVGTFLIRNSSNPKFLFSLSVQTDRGPTSVRLHYTNGYFKLDAQTHLQGVMPAFPNVIDLIQHYTHECEQLRKKPNIQQVWVDNQGKWYSPIMIRTPLKKKSEMSSLKHLARLAVHKAIQLSGKPRIPLLPPPYKQLELPNSLISYLGDYPHSI
ncbi:unnamed protein product [Ceutorhynchus assimilis]|uniref:Cytokine-inducible SH2-containing protein n=1 Tax=Ceutorhynchus assimilis TaxID=467358 RepID=A0A9N9MZX6_9CUCU|nr:unnamed protein product [Ceutorhynchus assimilis]